MKFFKGSNFEHAPNWSFEQRYFLMFLHLANLQHFWNFHLDLILSVETRGKILSKTELKILSFDIFIYIKTYNCNIFNRIFLDPFISNALSNMKHYQ